MADKADKAKAREANEKARQEEAAKKALEAEAERTLAKRLAFGLPLATVGGAVVVGFVTNFATAVLVMVGGALVAVIAWIWASLRTLTGDAPLPEQLEEAAVAVLPLDEKRSRRQMLLRSLKDLENERAIGKLDLEDYETVAPRYRREIKQIMREMDEALAPYRGQAEAAAKAYLDNVALGDEGEDEEPAPKSNGSVREKTSGKAKSGSEVDTRACPKCATQNDTDAKFCKACATPLAMSDKSTETEMP